MKKLISIALAMVLMLTMTSCGLMEEFVRETLGDEAADEYRAQNEIALEQLKESGEELGEILKEELGDDAEEIKNELKDEVEDVLEEIGEMPYPGKMTVAELREKFPHNRYWNRVGLDVANNQDGTTGEPCPKGHSSSISCNYFAPNGTKLSAQCMGFAEKLGYDYTGLNPRETKVLKEDGEISYTWVTVTDIGINAALAALKPGDIVRYVMYYDKPETVTNEYTEHSIFVLGVDGETVTYVDCNGHGAPERCIIEWDKTITKTTLQNKGLVHIRIAPYKVR